MNILNGFFDFVLDCAIDILQKFDKSLLNKLCLKMNEIDYFIKKCSTKLDLLTKENVLFFI